MNILYICADRGIPVLGHKGAAVHVRSLATALHQLGHSVTLATPRPGHGEQTDADIVHIPLPPTERDDAISREHQARAYADVLYEALHTLATQRNFGLIYERYSIWSDVGARLADSTGLPFVLEVNAPLRQEAERYRSLAAVDAATSVEQTQFGRADVIVTVSEPLCAYVAANGGSADRILIQPNAVDPHTFHPAVGGGKIRDRYNLHGKKVLGFVGRVRPWHDMSTVLRALATLRQEDPAFHLLLVGQTDSEISESVEQLGLSHAVTMTGPLPHAAIPQHIAAMDVAISSHVGQADSYFSPLKLFEYLACGVPTVAARVGQPAELLMNGTRGRLYTPESPTDLAAQIRALLAAPGVAQKMAWRGAAHVLTHHTWTANAHAAVAAAVGEDAVAARAPQLRPGASLNAPILDEKLRHRLYRATRPDLALPLLRRAFYDTSFRPKRIQRIRLLKYKPRRRCVLAYDLIGRDRTTGARRHISLIGKVFRDERGARLNALQAALWHGGFEASAADGTAVAPAYGYIPKMRMQLQGGVPGRTLDALAAAGEPIAPWMAPTGRALAKLHRWDVPADVTALLRRHPLAREVRLIDEFAGKLTHHLAAESVDRAQRALRAWAARLPDPPGLMAVHRDFYYSQLLVDGEEITLIDFDLLAWGDPAIDVANFTAHLALLGLTEHGATKHYAAEERQFLDAYAACFPVDDAFWERHAFYAAATLFRLLHVTVTRPHWRHHVATLSALLDESLVRDARPVPHA